MKLKLNLIVAAAALASAGAANANPIQDFTLGNSSLTFVALDNSVTGGTAKGSIVIDLGKSFTDFLAGTAATATPGEIITWDFSTNAITVNGIQQSVVANWSAPFAFFLSHTNLTDVRYGVIAGNNAGSTTQFLTTGAPTAAQITSQTGALTANMAQVNSLYSNNNNAVADGATIVNTWATTGFGANATTLVTTNAAGGVAGSTNLNSAGTWQANLKWNATLAEGTATSLYFLDSNLPDGSAASVASAPLGQFNFSGNTLTWTVAAVPEPDGYALALAGVGVLGFVSRRRRNA
jgi:MYXO-CTERM domain-containing protein